MNTSPRLPSQNDTNQARVIKLLSDAIIGAYSHMADLERRLGSLEGRTTSRSKTQLWEHFKLIEVTNPTRLALYYTPDGITLQEPPLTEYVPET